MEEAGNAIIIVMRVCAFIIGVLLLISGIVEFGVLGGGDIITQFSAGPIGLIKVLVGVILMLAGIEPQIISVAIGWIVRSPVDRAF